MANNNRIRFDIDGDASGLRRALAQGGNSISDFAGESGELLGGLSGQFGDLTSRIGGLGTGMAGVAGGLGLLAGGVTALVLSSNEYVKTLNEISRSSGLTVTELQQLQTVFQGLGLDVEKFADINKDALDHLGDGFRDGSGVAQDLKAYGVNLQDLNKYLNQTDGGIKAVAHTFYQLKESGKSISEITNAMESLSSDSSKLVDVMKNYGSETELMNAIYSTHAQLTDENAKKYQEFDKTVTTLSTSFQLWKANALSPTIVELNKILEVMNGGNWTDNSFMDMMREFYYGGDNAIAQGLRKIDGVQEIGYSITATANLDAQAKSLLDFVNGATKPKTDTTPKGGWVDKGKEEAAAKAAQAKKEAQAKAAATKAETLAKKTADDRIKAQDTLNKAISDMTIESNARQLSEFDRQQKALVLSIQKSAKTLGLSQGQLTGLLSQQQASSNAKRTDMVNGMIGYTDPNQGLKDTNSLISSGGLNKQQSGYLADQQNQRINGDNPFNYDNTDQQQQQNTEAMNLELKQNEMLLQGHEDYEKKKQEITTKYNTQALNIANQNKLAQLSVFSTAATSLTDGLVSAFGESSGAAKAALLVQKGVSMAMISMNLATALSSALATPFPASIAAYAQVLTLGMSLISTASGATSGQFHGGIDSVPASMDNKSFILKGSERVVQPEANKKLTKFLDNQSTNKSSGDITVNAPLLVQGSSGDEDAKFTEMLKRHQNSVVQAVRNSQQRNT
ncbi:hypothetical protein AB6866_04790 [Rahnella inusitata]|uniref:hypothetical protein n=1 Tax=Rahnella inusitata TaxID=58169 RepID=UPI0039BE32F3